MTPEFFVARDRARRLAWRLEKVLQERRLAWRGDEIGMASIADDAHAVLAEIASDARRSVDAVLAGEIRDRERGFMEIPFAVAVTTVARRIERAAGVEGQRRLRRAAEKRAQREVEDELSAALQRLEAFQAAYDAKTPLPDGRPVDVAHLLTRLGPREGRPWDRPPPPLVTDGHGLEDLLLAVQGALHADDEPWQVLPAGPGRALMIGLGCADGKPDEAGIPPEVERAARVLTFRHPVVVETRASGASSDAPRLCGLFLKLGDPKGENLEAAVTIATGGEARLSAEAEPVVRALTNAPPAEEGHGIPPERLVALLGVLRVLDAELRGCLAEGVPTPDVRYAATQIPREKTRKAAIRKALLEALEHEIEGLEVKGLGRLAERIADGRWDGRKCSCMEAGLLLAVFGRNVALGGVRLERALDFDPLTDDETTALAQSLVHVAIVRRDLESGRDVNATALTRLECGAIAVLGRLGRLGRQQ